MIDFVGLAKDLGIELTSEMLHQYQTYYEFLISENEKINLTGIVDIDGVYLKHFYDSLTMVKANISKDAHICDIGAGAGFPSIPLKIAYPSLKITIVDSLQKRTVFLNELVRKLGLSDVNIIWGRAEEVSNADFDIVTARAVARLNILDELCLPLVKKDGYFIAMKSASLEEEIKEAKQGISILGGRIEEVISFELPIENSLRNILVVKKIKDTPGKYPRKFASIKKSPL